MSEQIAVRHLCPVCGSERTDHGATMGHRRVWQCSHCARVFQPARKKGSVLLKMKTLFVGENAR